MVFIAKLCYEFTVLILMWYVVMFLCFLYRYISLLVTSSGSSLFAFPPPPPAVLFLEFWKRTQSQLQFEWDTLGYEASAVSTQYITMYQRACCKDHLATWANNSAPVL